MHTEGVDHGQATIKLHTGQDTFIRPSIGSWMVYGLGSENQNLPGFVSVCPQRSDVGVRGYSNAFLPAYSQGTAIGQEDVPAAKATIHNITNGRLPAALQRRELDLLQQMNAITWRERIAMASWRVLSNRSSWPSACKPRRPRYSIFLMNRRNCSRATALELRKPTILAASA